MSLVNITINKILSLIKNENLKANDKIPTVEELSSKFQVGRSTIREALKVLSAQNIIVSKQGAGTFVTDKISTVKDPLGIGLVIEDIDVIFDLVTLRLIFEPEMAAMAAQFSTEEDLNTIKKYCLKVETLIANSEEYSKEDALFHIAIAKASGNSIIHKITEVIYSSIRKNIFMTDNTLYKETLLIHRQIVKCIEEKDINGAKYAMINHLEAQRRFLINNYELNKRY